MPLPSGTRLGPYEIQSQLGAGGMGEVYRARDPRLDRDVAIKVLPERLAQDAEALARFEREAKTVASLSHPNILAIHDLGKEQGVNFAVMELLEGETLGARLKESPLPWRKAVEIAVAVAEGLAAAHSKGITHRDLKPENIFLTSDGRVKILDFGLARVAPPFSTHDGSTLGSDRPVVGGKTRPGSVLGTIGYMSPEQVRGEPVGPASDLFSLGCVLYEMIAGIRPFPQESFAEALAAILKETPADLTVKVKDIHPELERMISRCLEKNPENRFQSARDFAFALRAISSSSEVGRPAAARPGLRIRPAILAGALGVVALGVALALWLTRGQAIDSLAVLPFANAGGDPNTEYLSDGITEAIIKNLSQLPNLGVMSRSSVFRYKGKDVDPKTVGSDLKVRAVLVGRLTQRGDNLSISTELVDTNTNRQIWGEQYNRKLADLIAVQEEIASEISDKLRLRLTGEEKQKLAKRYTQNTEAYQLYLQGRYQWNKRTLEGMQQSIDFFQQAIAKDPRYAQGHAGLADAYALLADYHVLPAREVMPRAKAAAMEALKIDDTLAEAHASLGWTKLTHDWAWADAEREFKRAIQLDPNYATAHHWYGEYLLLIGRVNDALAEVKRAQELEPVSLVINRALGSAYFFARQYDQAVEQCRKTLLMDPNFVGARVFLGRAYAQKGAQLEAIAEFQKALQISEGNSNELAALGHAYAAAGNRAEAARILAQLKERSQQTYVQPMWIATIHAALGEKDQAFEWLQKAYEDRSGWLVYLKTDPMFDPLRSDPRFTDVLRRVGLPS